MHSPKPTITATNWPTTIGVPPLDGATAQLWAVDLRQVPLPEELCLSLLTGEELQRASRMKHSLARLHFLTGRAALRHLLAAQLGSQLGSQHGSAPQNLPLTASAHGKLSLPDSGLEFNLAHSGGVILLALRRGAPLGIDLEQINAARPLDDLARHALSPAEQDLYFAVPAQHKTQLFYRLWAAKEAVLKADGRGLSVASSSFTVQLPTQLPAQPHQSIPSLMLPEADTSIYVTELPPLSGAEDGFAAALASVGASAEFSTHRFPSGCLP